MACTAVQSPDRFIARQTSCQVRLLWLNWWPCCRIRRLGSLCCRLKTLPLPPAPDPRVHPQANLTTALVRFTSDKLVLPGLQAASLNMHLRRSQSGDDNQSPDWRCPGLGFPVSEPFNPFLNQLEAFTGAMVNIFGDSN